MPLLPLVHPGMTASGSAAAAATAAASRAACVAIRPVATALPGTGTLALPRETVGSDIAERCLHRIGLGLFGALIGPVIGLACVGVVGKRPVPASAKVARRLRLAG